MPSTKPSSANSKPVRSAASPKRRWLTLFLASFGTVAALIIFGIAWTWAYFSLSQPAPYVQAAAGQIVIDEIEKLQQSEGVLAFPGALGFGKQALGGRGARVVIVNTRDNIVDPNDDLISLREAIEVESGPRTIVFSVGGLFDAGEEGLNLVGDGDSNVSVACQSAPVPGVVVRTQGFNIQNGASDIVFRHCAVRLIDAGQPLSESGRGFTVRGGSSNIVLDHMSFAWATDEGFQAYLAPDQTEGIDNITVSNSIVAEGDADSSHPLSEEHPDWLYHSMGPSCNNNNPNQLLSNCSIVNNFIAHNSSRNAMIWGGSGELSNNVIYNWAGVGLTAQTHVGGDVNVIVNNNLMKAGPNSEGSLSNPKCGKGRFHCALYLGASDEQGVSRYLVGENHYISKHMPMWWASRIKHDNAKTPDGEPAFDAATPSPISVRDMAAKGSRFMGCVGASMPQRDAVDDRVIAEFYSGDGSVGIGDNDRTGGHNVNEQRTWDLFEQTSSHPADYDTDRDGMPDTWEAAYGLDSANPDDHSADKDGDGYTNIEEYLAIAAHC